MPSEFGPDPYAPLVKESPIIVSKKKYRDLAEELELSWISVVCNPYLDWSLKNGSWSIDIKGRKAKRASSVDDECVDEVQLDRLILVHKTLLLAT